MKGLKYLDKEIFSCQILVNKSQGGLETLGVSITISEAQFLIDI